MAVAGTLSHRYPAEPGLTTRASQSGAHFSNIAENIAQGPHAAQIEQQWMHSPPPRANILDPRMNQIGIAVTASNGTLYAAQTFLCATRSASQSPHPQFQECDPRSQLLVQIG